eukprot:433567-Amphidinium_carterae.1
MTNRGRNAHAFAQSVQKKRKSNKKNKKSKQALNPTYCRFGYHSVGKRGKQLELIWRRHSRMPWALKPLLTIGEPNDRYYIDNYNNNNNNNKYWQMVSHDDK